MIVVRRPLRIVPTWKPPAHATTVWTRDWPEAGRWAWACRCGVRTTVDHPTMGDAKTEADGHLRTAR